LAATIKPHLAIGGPLLLLYYTLCVQRSTTRSLLADLFYQVAVAGIALTSAIALPLLWLRNEGGLPAFWEMLTSYLPLHVDMTGNIETVTAEAKLQYYQKKLSRDLP
jgi:hypothetical protein